MEYALPVCPAEGMGTEAVPLGLEQIQWSLGVPQPVVVAQAGGKGGDGHAVPDGGGHNLPPVLLVVLQHLGEAGVQQQIFQLGLGAVDPGQLVEEGGPDDAAPPEQQGDAAQVQVPAVGLSGTAQQIKALGVGAQLGGVQRPADLLGKGGAVGDGRGGRGGGDRKSVV